MLGYSQNSDFIASLNSEAKNLEIVDFNSSNLSETFEEPAAHEMMVDASGCFGSFGTYGCG